MNFIWIRCVRVFFTHQKPRYLAIFRKNVHFEWGFVPIWWVKIVRIEKFFFSVERPPKSASDWMGLIFLRHVQKIGKIKDGGAKSGKNRSKTVRVAYTIAGHGEPGRILKIGSYSRKGKMSTSKPWKNEVHRSTNNFTTLWKKKIEQPTLII